MPGLPRVDDIVQCAVAFPYFWTQTSSVPHFAVLFYDAQCPGAGSMKLPESLRDDEQGDDGEMARDVRERGVHMITAVDYITDVRTATYWLRRDVLDEVVRKTSWHVGVCRSDLWEVIPSSTVPAHEVVELLANWTQ